MCCDFSPSPNSEITARLAALRAAKPALERRMANELLDFYRRIADGCRARLNPGGAVMVEIGAGQRNSVEALFRCAGFSKIDAMRDLARIERVIVAK